MTPERISILIPVKDGGEDLARCLAGIERQSAAARVEVVIVDSGSADGSVERARRWGARVLEIPAAAFDHGSSRNLAAASAEGEVLVFLSQDAEPLGSEWLASLVSALERDPTVSGAYGRQVPRPGAAPPERYFLGFLYGDRPRLQAAAGPDELTMETTLFSNVNSAVRRGTWERFRFAEDMIMSEDQEWAGRVLLAGGRIAYEPRAAVFHSHAYGIRSAFRRFFDSGVSAERAFLAGSASASALRANAVRYATGQLAWLARSGQARWIPYACVYELAKFTGLQLGKRYRRIPPTMRRRMSAHPGWWSRANEPAEPAP